MNKIIRDKLEAIKELCRCYNVSSLHVFGSANTARFNETSDIDLLIDFKPTIGIEEYTDCYFALHDKLTALLKRKIDLVTRRSLSNPFFINNVEQSKQVIYVEPQPEEISV